MTHLRSSILLVGSGILLLSMAAAPPSVGAEILHQDSTYEDFAQGDLGTSVANLYVSRKGNVQMINLWDLNQDGHLDLLFNNSHNNTNTLDALVFFGTPGGLSPDNQVGLPTHSGYCAAISDLNKDGHLDVVIANGFDGASRQTNIFIYYGSAEGLTPERYCSLPGRDAVGLAVGDVDGDSFEDIVYASSHEGGYLRMFWGTAQGFEEWHSSRIELAGVVTCVAGDFIGDGRAEIAVATSRSAVNEVQVWGCSDEGRKLALMQSLAAPGTRRLQAAQVTGDARPDLVCVRNEQPRLLVYAGGSDQLAAEPVVQLSLPATSGCAFGDLNDDDLCDLVVSRIDGNTSAIYWGAEDGFSTDRIQQLPSINAADACIGDFNGDGSRDIALANEYEGNERATVSYIYWGQAGKFSPERRTELPTDGASQVLAADLTGNSLSDLLVVSPIGGQIRERVPSRIYWGGEGGQFSADRYTDLEARAPYESTMADFNDDGFVDVFIANNWESYPLAQDKGSYVYWGGPEGFSTERRTVLDTKRAMGSSTADFNKDGYLDLAATSSGGYDVVFWGGADGFSNDRQTPLVEPQGIVKSGAGGCCADLNKDGWVDIINPHVYQPYVAIHWGGPDAFTAQNVTLLPTGYIASAEMADLNGDGWLELLVGGFWDNNQPDTRWRVPTLIYWGSPQGYSQARVQELPGLGCHEIAVADLNNDGVLDIVLSSYRDQLWRSVYSYIYWGEPGGVYRWDNCTHLHNHSAAGNLIADFNRDGWRDIVFVNHTQRGNHNTLSRVWWNSPDGFSEEHLTFLPTFGAHQMASTDIGNIYDRRFEETYISRPIQIPEGSVIDRLDWQARTLLGTTVKFQLRQARSPRQLARARWHGPHGADSYYAQPGKLRRLIAAPTWVQYRAILCTPDGGNSPILDEVTLEGRQG